MGVLRDILRPVLRPVLTSFLEQFPQDVIPAQSKALFILDGTLSGSEFIDVSGNGRNFTISDKDFTASYFPYKSEATVSAPVGDAILIAADINNFLYDSEGDPNDIPVVSLFQNIDYENKLFCRHISQVLNDDDIETSEPYVTDIVLYSSVLTGSDLTIANTYYSVPIDDSDITVAKSGGDYTTLSAAVSAATSGQKIKVKTGEYTETGTNNLIVQKEVHIKGVGGVIVKGGSGTATKAIIRHDYDGAGSYTGLVIDAEDNYSYNTQATKGSAIFDRCYCKGATTYSTYQIYGTLSNSVVTDKRMYSGPAGFIMDTIFTNIADNYTFNLTGGTEFTLKNSKVKSNATVQTFLKITTATANIYGNVFEILTDKKIIYYSTVTTINIHHNTFESILNLTEEVINSGDPNTSDCNIYNNTFDLNGITSTHDIIALVNGGDISVYNNKFLSESTTANSCVKVNSTGTTIASCKVYGNLLNYKHKDGYGITIGTQSSGANNEKISGIEVYENSLFGAIYHDASILETGSCHSIFVGHNKDAEIHHNRTYGSQYAVVYKGSGQIGGFVNYNIFKNCIQGIRIKGIVDSEAYGNIYYSELVAVTPYAIYVSDNEGSGVPDCTIRNNIFVQKNATLNIRYVDYATLTSDYNVFYSDTGYNFHIDGADYATLTLYQAGESMDVNSEDSNPLLVNEIPQNGSPALGGGETLNSAYDDGLDASTDWGDDETLPDVTTKQQTAPWDCGAYVS